MEKSGYPVKYGARSSENRDQKLSCTEKYRYLGIFRQKLFSFGKEHSRISAIRLLDKYPAKSVVRGILTYNP